MLKRTHSIARKGLAVACALTMGLGLVACGTVNGKAVDATEVSSAKKSQKDESSDTMKVTIPSYYFQGSEYAGKSTKQIKKLLEKTIGTKAVKNKNGSWTVTMTKEQYKSFSSKLRKSVKAALDAMASSDAFPNVTKVEHKDVKCTVTLVGKDGKVLDKTVVPDDVKVDKSKVKDAQDAANDLLGSLSVDGITIDSDNLPNIDFQNVSSSDIESARQKANDALASAQKKLQDDTQTAQAAANAYADAASRADDSTKKASDAGAALEKATAACDEAKSAYDSAQAFRDAYDSAQEKADALRKKATQLAGEADELGATQPGLDNAAATAAARAKALAALASRLAKLSAADAVLADPSVLDPDIADMRDYQSDLDEVKALASEYADDLEAIKAHATKANELQVTVDDAQAGLDEAQEELEAANGRLQDAQMAVAIEKAMAQPAGETKPAGTYVPKHFAAATSASVPRTADANDPGLPVALGLSGLAVLGVATRRRRRVQE